MQYCLLNIFNSFKYNLPKSGKKTHYDRYDYIDQNQLEHKSSAIEWNEQIDHHLHKKMFTIFRQK